MADKNLSGYQISTFQGTSTNSYPQLIASGALSPLVASAGFPEVGQGKIYKQTAIIDGVAFTAGNGAAMNTTDTYLLMPIPANALVKQCVINVLTAEGGTSTLNIGTRIGSTNNATAFASGANANSVAASGYFALIADLAKLLFTSAGYITAAVASGTLAAAVVKVEVTFEDMTGIMA